MNERIYNSNFIRIFIASILLLTGNQIIMVVLPLFLQDLGSAPSVLGIATSISALAAMTARPIAGWMADKKSRKLVMNLGLLVMIIGMLGFIALPFAVAVIAIRFAQGFGISAATTAQMAIATDVLPPSKVKKGLSYIGVCTTLAGAFGPSLGLALVFGSNYYPAWIGGAVVFAAAFIIVSTFTYEKSMPRKTTTLEEHTNTKWLWRYFEKKAFLPSVIQMMLMVANAGIVFLPTYAVGIGIKDIGIFFILQACTMLVANIAVGNLIDRVRNPLFFLMPAIVCFASSFAVLSITDGSKLFLVAALLYGLGLGTSTSIISVITMSSTTPQRRGAASATFQCSTDIGFCIGSLAGGLIAGLLGYRMFYAIMALLPVFAGLMSIYIFGFKKIKSERVID